MLRGSSLDLKRRLLERGVTVAIIGLKQVTSSIPDHAFLKGVSCGPDRTFDEGTRGVGGTVYVPCSSVGEENLLMWNEDPYGQESIMVHEFAHTIMNCGFNEGQREALEAVYEACRGRPEFDSTQYWMCNSEEFWAEMVQGWYEASIRVDVNHGINTRRGLEATLPELVPLLQEVFGENPWSYRTSCPRPQKWCSDCGVSLRT